MPQASHRAASGDFSIDWDQIPQGLPRHHLGNWDSRASATPWRNRCLVSPSVYPFPTLFYVCCIALHTDLGSQFVASVYRILCINVQPSATSIH